MSAQLVADFEMRYSGGATIRVAFSQPMEGPNVTVLFGPSGSGKTTTLRCLAGLERPQRGSIRVGDVTWLDADTGIHLRPQARGVGFLFQDFALFPHLSVERNIAYGIGSLSHSDRGQRVRRLLDVLGLIGLEKRYPHQLSAGQQQRVALARAVAPRPRMLLLDEPLSALDAPTREPLRGELRRLLTAFATPAILVTHDPIEAVALADQAVVLSDGHVRQRGPVHEVFSRPTDPTVARIVGIETIEPGIVLNVSDGLATVRAGTIELLAVAPNASAGSVFVCIRGEDVIVERGELPQTSARNRLRARIVNLVPEGPTVRLTLECGFPLTALITRPAAEQLQLKQNDSVLALIKAQAIHLVPRA